MEIATGRVRTFRLEECRFGYRNSVFKQEAKGRYIILAVRFRLTTREHRLNLGYAALASLRPTPTTIRDVCEAVIAIRRSKLPDPADWATPAASSRTRVSLEQCGAEGGAPGWWPIRLKAA